MRRSRIRRHFYALTACAAVVALLAGCAPEPVAGWLPAPLAAVPGVSLAAAPAVAPAPDQNALGLYTGRLRNDTVGFAARFVFIPGVPAFNERVTNELRAAIAATGAPYAPQTYAAEAGRTERGCVPDSSAWPATDVLSRVETGTSSGSGTVVTCELAGAYGDVVEVRLRVVTGVAGSVTADRVTVLFVNVATGQLIEGGEAWNATAAPALWRAVVELLRRDAGALSTAPVTEPDPAQLALAAAALRTADDTADGGLALQIPAGIAAPELAGLGVAATTAPLRLRIDPATAIAWATAPFRQLHAELGKPFAGLSTRVSAVPIACDLIPCVAVTYDDGPSELTSTLLDTLAAERGRATFFVLSSKASAAPATVQRAIAEGHEVGTHTINHPDLTSLPIAEAKAQLLDSAAVISQIAGVPVTMFRPPYGEVNREIIAAVGMPSILWNVDTNDWRQPGQAALVERSAAVANPGDIILFHDTHEDTVAAAPAVVRGLHDRGLELVTVTQLFGGQVPAGKVRSR